MPDLRTYDIGAVAVTAAGAVTVTTGIWSDANVQPGDSISIDGGPALLIRSKSDTGHAQIVGWDGGDVSGKSYEVFQDASYRFDDVELALDLKDQVTALNKINYFIPVQDDEAAPDPSLGDESQRAFKDLTGQWWKKESGVWNLKNSPYGMQAANALSEIAALGKQADARANIGAQAALGYTPVNKAGDTMGGALKVQNVAGGNWHIDASSANVLLADGASFNLSAGKGVWITRCANNDTIGIYIVSGSVPVKVGGDAAWGTVDGVAGTSSVNYYVPDGLFFIRNNLGGPAYFSLLALRVG